MDRLIKYVGFLFISFLSFQKVFAELFNVKIATDSHINVVDSRFLSFTVDPKYLFTNNDFYSSKECVCMASALSPAFIRIAGPTTSRLSFKNHSISIQPNSLNKKITLNDFLTKPDETSEGDFEISFQQWKKFAKWSKDTGFELIFALNNERRKATWDSNVAMEILSMAEKSKIDNVVWQLGYECQNQTIEEYINDLETLRMLINSFPRELKWRVVGGDITPCLKRQSKSDFKDYVSLSNELFDAIFLDGNSSSYELEKMSHKDRLRLLNTLSNSETPLWLSESTSLVAESELQRASSWLYSLGQSARNGFSVHFRESKEEELLRPTKSFYMALLYKNLVGEKVLDVSIDTPSEQTFLYAHCTSLRHEPVPGAVTLFGANMADETARFSLKLSKREDGGDIMQFILGADINGNIMVNGRAMYFEGDIRPIVKRVRPYKTLLINLPPKSFGFWVLANTKIEACQEINLENNLVKAEIVSDNSNNFVVEDKDVKRKKRSINSTDIQSAQIINSEDHSSLINSETLTKLFKRIDNLNKGLREVHDSKLARHERVTDLDRGKRQSNREAIKEREKDDLKEDNDRKRMRRPIGNLSRNRADKKSAVDSRVTETRPRSGIVARILQLNTRLNRTRNARRKSGQKSKVSKRSPKKLAARYANLKKSIPIDESESSGTIELKSRGKRSTDLSKKERFEEDIKEILSLNEVDVEGPKYERISNILHKIKEQLNGKDSEIPIDIKSAENDGGPSIEEQFIVKTHISDDDTSISFSEKSKDGFFKTTFSKMVDLLDDLNNKMNKLAHTLNFLE